MREIKFRGYCKDRKVWIYFTLSDLDLGLLSIPFDELDIITQFTGLKDKNGKEIFEGDIVKCEVEHKGNFIIQEIKDIKWDYPNEISVIDNVYQVEVIGNIYENPELLEVQNK